MKALLALANPSTSIQAYEGAVRSGKTFASLIDWVRFIRNGPEGTLAMCGRTERTIVNNLLIPLQELLGAHRVKINYGQGTATILGRRVNLYGADNEAARTKIQGLTLVGAYVDEASTVPESFFNMLYSRLSERGAKLWLTTNPEGPAHWLKRYWLDKAALWIDGAGRITRNDSDEALDLHRYTFLIDDNDTLPAEFVERQKRSYGGLFYRRYILAEWVAAEGAVFDSWDPEKHIVPWVDLPKMRKLLAVGVDYGSTNPTSAVLLGLGDDGALYAVDEMRRDTSNTHRALTINEVARELKTWTEADRLHDQKMKPEWLCVDPSAAPLKTEFGSLGMHNVIDGDNSVLYGIQTMSALLADGKLKVSDKCTGLIDEFPGYSWSPQATEKGEDKPIKVADHSLDAFRYAIITTETNWRPHMRTTQ